MSCWVDLVVYVCHLEARGICSEGIMGSASCRKSHGRAMAKLIVDRWILGVCALIKVSWDKLRGQEVEFGGSCMKRSRSDAGDVSTCETTTLGQFTRIWNLCQYNLKDHRVMFVDAVLVPPITITMKPSFVVCILPSGDDNIPNRF